MSLESATWVTQLSATDPLSSDPRSQGDDHLRLVKSVMQTELSAANRQWIYTGDSAVWATSTALVIDGDRTADYEPGRRVKVTGESTGTLYGHVTSTTFSAQTTINFSFDSGSMANETLTPFVSLLTRSNHALPRDTISVKDFGAVGDGATDDTAAIQAALDYAATFPFGRTVFMPAGQYFISDTLNLASDYINLIGESYPFTRITRTGDFGTSINVSEGGGTSKLLYGSIENIQVVANAAMTNGALIRLDVVSNFMVKNCLVLDGYIGIHAISCQSIVLDHCLVQAGTKYVVGVNEAFAYLYFDADLTATTQNNNAVIRHCNFRSKDDDNSHATDGVHIRTADGLWFDQCHFGNTTGALMLATPKDGSATIAGINLNNCWFDRTTGIGLSFTGTTTGQYQSHGVYNCFFSGAEVGTRAISFNTSTALKDIQVDGCKIYQWDTHGIYADNVTNLAIKNNTIRDFGTDGANTGIGVNIQSGVSNYSITANDVGYTVAGVALTGNNYAIRADGTNGLVADNDCRGNFNNGIFDGGVDVTTVIRDSQYDSMPNIASAATLPAATAGNIFKVSGTATVTSIEHPVAGRQITMIFTSTATITDGGTIKLAGGNFVATADDTLTLVADGTNWHEIGRAVN